MLDFFPGAERAPPAHRAVDGIDRDFLSRNARLPCSRPGVQPPPFLYTRYLDIQSPGAQHDNPGKNIVKYFLKNFTIESRYDFRD